MGFYPVCPGSDQYILGTPFFRDMVLHLENGNDVTISAPANSDKNRYVQKLQLNGNEYGKNYVNHSDLIKGAKMDFVMSSEPNTNRGVNEESFPYSFSKEYKLPEKSKKTKKSKR